MAEWISVKDRLPERGERVLASVEGNGVFEAFLTIKKVWVRGGIEMERWYGTVTHWMPMPETPKGTTPEGQPLNDYKEAMKGGEEIGRIHRSKRLI